MLKLRQFLNRLIGTPEQRLHIANLRNKFSDIANTISRIHGTNCTIRFDIPTNSLSIHITSDNVRYTIIGTGNIHYDHLDRRNTINVNAIVDQYFTDPVINVIRNHLAPYRVNFARP